MSNITRPPVSSKRQVSAAERLKQYNEKSHVGHMEEDAEELKMKKLFSQRTAHLPGNNWCQDWVQFMQNNHPLLGLCCRHRLNPIGVAPRLVILLSSISFGLIATNIVFLFYRYYDADGLVVDLGSIKITYETIALWTLGGILHSLTDLGMWHLTACACCLPGTGCHKRCGFLGKVGPYAAIAVAAGLSAAATFVILMRASYEDSTNSANEINDESSLTDDFESYSFLFTYGMELVLVYLFYHPMLSTLFFSGAVWGILPCIGGRPKEILRQANEAKAQSLGRNSNDNIV